MATGSKFPHDLKLDERFYYKGRWVTADFIAIGRPSTTWVTVHLKERGEDNVVPVIMLAASERVLVVVEPSAAERRDRYLRGRRALLRNNARRINWR